MSTSKFNFLDTINRLNATYGAGSVLKGDEVLPMERTSTGSLGLDIITGGGWPKGRIIESFGPESSGKTTIFLHGLVQAQKAEPEKYIVIIDFENALDSKYCESLGLDMSRVHISQPDYGEVGFQFAEELISSGEVSVCLIDSIATATPKAEIEGEMQDNQMGLQARLISKALRKLVKAVSSTNTILFMTNQLRMKIGVVFGNPEVTSGGNAPKFYSSIRLDIRASKGSADTQGIISENKVTVKTVKNKTAPPFQKCMFDIVYGKGIDKSGEILDIAVELKFIKKSGSWFSYENTKLGQGRSAAKALIEDNPDLSDEIENRILEAYNLPIKKSNGKK